MDIVKYPAKSLSEKCVEFDPKTPESIAFMKEMERTVRDTPCLGMAAPQVGKNIRVFWLKLGIDIVPYINPTILKRSSRTYLTSEGCLSLEPGKLYPVTRHHTVKMEWTDRTGRKRRETLQGLEAQVVQHEYDHLEGIMLNDAEKRS